MNKFLEGKSRFLSLVLRHKPEKANITLDSNGWADVDQILTNLDLTMEELEEIVATNDKKRFSFNADKTEIKAAQGHSVEGVEVQLEKKIPPVTLYHGTKKDYLSSILKMGLDKRDRHHVHLSDNLGTAENVAGRRKGDSIILEIDTKQMVKEGYDFFLSDNKVWLTNFVPPQFITIKK